MTARLVFLGRLEEQAGRAFDDVALDAPLGWTALLQRLAPGLAEIVSGDRIRIALNGALVGDKQGIILADGDEIAFLPPVSGG
jgi:molybdopterin converting factor small subunit